MATKTYLSMAAGLMRLSCNQATLKKLVSHTGLGLIVVTGSVFSAHADDDFMQALTKGHSDVNLRYRLETVSQDNSLKDARASTARLRAGYQTGDFYGLSAMTEAQALGFVGQDLYNSTLNGKTQYATVADPAVTEMDQLYLAYDSLPDTVAKYGRQRIQLDNQRFIGNVGWRQIEQTFDATTVVNKSLPDTTVTAGYIYNIHRVFGDTSPVGIYKSKSPILNINTKLIPHAELSLYGYGLNLPFQAALSTKTYGFRLTGSAPLNDAMKVLYTAEFAHQSNYENNPVAYSDRYHMLEAGVSVQGVELKLSHELLGGNDICPACSFQTPLATLHSFSGWADMFLVTPQAGLKDTFFTVGGKVADIKLDAIYRDLRTDLGNQRYGTEWDFDAVKNFGTHFSLGAALAAYHSDDLTFGSNIKTSNVSTTKGWVWGEMKF